MFKPRILIIEDDHSLSLLLLHCLGNHYLVHLAGSLAEAYRVLDKQKIDLVIIDRVLPDGDGLELVSYLHDNSFLTRSLILSHKSMLADRVDGLQTGADDYLGKPFGTSELLLRVKRLLEKEKISRTDMIETNTFKLDLQSGTVSAQQFNVQLRRREMQILAFLMRRRNQVVDRNSIIAGVWGAVTAQPTTASLDVYVRRIRLRLGKYASCVKTHRSYGYVFCEPAK